MRIAAGVVPWLAAALVAGAPGGCAQAPDGSPAAVSTTPTEGGPTAPDLGLALRRVHFAFRPESGAFAGGHTTYAVRADGRDLRVTPAMPAPEPGEAVLAREPLVLAAAGIARGDTQLDGPPSAALRDDGTIAVDRGGVVERIENDEEGVEQSWSFSQKPRGSGDVTFQIAVSGEAYVGATPGGLHFADASTGLGVRYGNATWVDARGVRTAAPVAFEGGRIVIRVPADVVEESAYPALLDPTIGPELGTDNPVVQYAPNDQMGAVVALAGGTYLVAWTDSRATLSEIYATRVATNGTLLDPTGIRIMSSSSVAVPAIASNGTDWFVVASTGAGITGARVSAAGAVLDAIPIGIDAAGSWPGVAWSGASYMVGYAAGLNVKAKRVNANGVVLDPSPIAVTSVPAGNSQLNVSVGFNGTNFLVAYAHSIQSPTTYKVDARRMTPAGVVLDASDIALASDPLFIPSVDLASNGTDWLATWGIPQGSGTIRIQRVSAAGAPLDGANGAVVSASGYSSRVAYGAGAYGIFWQGNGEMSAAKVGGNGAVLATASNLIGEPGMHYELDVASDGAGFYVAYRDTRFSTPSNVSDIFGVRMSALLAKADPTSTLLSQAANKQQNPVIAFNGTNYLVVWEDLRSGSTTDLYATRISAAGTVLDPAGIAITTAAGDDLHAAVASNGTDWLVAWQDTVNGAGNEDIRGTRVSAAGQVLDVGGIGIATMAGAQTGAEVASNGADYFVVWGDPTAFTISGARVSSAGAVLDPGGVMIAGNTYPTSTSAGWNGLSYLVSAATLQNKIIASRITSGGVILDVGAAAIQVGSVSSATGTAVASDGTNFLVAWGGARARRVSANGAVLDAADISVGAGGAVGATWSGSNYWLVWGENLGKVYTARITSAGAVVDPSGVLVVSNAKSGVPAISAGTPGEVMVAYNRYDTSPSSGAVRVKERIINGLDPNGTLCAQVGQCASGYCVDGFCCDASCSGACQACSSVKKGGGQSGVCGPVVVGTDPDNECASQPQSTCGTTGACGGNGACATWSAGLSCPPACVGDTVQPRACDGMGSCAPSGLAQDCTPYACSAGACKSTCAANADCAAGLACVGGACAAVGPAGSACAAGGECQSGNCVDGVCCDTACVGTCQACTAAKKGQGVSGVCGPIKASTDPDDECTLQPSSTCMENGSCDGNGACALHPAGTVCLPPSCSGTSQAAASTCDGQGTCAMASTQKCAKGYQCVGDACSTECTDDSSCAPGFACDTSLGACAPAVDGGAGSGGAGGSGPASTGASTTGVGGSTTGVGGSTTGVGGSTTGASGSTTGTTGSATGTTGAGTGGSGSGNPDPAPAGCGCRMAGDASSTSSTTPAALITILALSALRRRRRAHAPR